MPGGGGLFPKRRARGGMALVGKPGSRPSGMVPSIFPVRAVRRCELTLIRWFYQRWGQGCIKFACSPRSRARYCLAVMPALVWVVTTQLESLNLPLKSIVVWNFHMTRGVVDRFLWRVICLALPPFYHPSAPRFAISKA